MPLPPTLPTDVEEYTARINEKKVCNDFFLGQGCNKEDCIYDHGEVSQNVLNVLRGIVRNKLKCTKRGECRSKLCYRGHSKTLYADNNIGIVWVDADEC